MTHEASQPQRSTRVMVRSIKIGLVLAVIVMLAAAYHFGILAQLAEPATLKKKLVELGTWGYVAFVVSYALLQPFGAPGTVYVFAAPLIWSWPVAFALNMIATMAASVLGFAFARFIARDWVESKLTGRFKKYDEALAQSGFATVAGLRSVLWMQQTLHAFFGVSKVSFWKYFWGCLAGYTIPLFLVSYFGQQIFDILYSLPTSVWIGIAIAAFVLALLAVRARRAQGRKSAGSTLSNE